MAPKADNFGRDIAEKITDREISHCLRTGIDTRVKALSEAGLTPIGAAERISEARHPANMVAAGTGAKVNCLSAKFRFNLRQFLGNFIEHIVPAKALPIAGAALTFAPHRIFKPVRVVDHFFGGIANGTETALIERTVWIAFDFYQHIVFYMQQGTAAAMTTSAHAFEDLCVLMCCL
jgi:hypothetical protein